MTENETLSIYDEQYTLVGLLRLGDMPSHPEGRSDSRSDSRSEDTTADESRRFVGFVSSVPVGFASFDES